MRVPDNGKTYPLPTGLGQLALRSVDDFSETAPVRWMQKGGVILPLARSEAIWIWLSSRYRFAVKIGAGMVNLLSGEAWSSDFRRQPQNYLVAPGPPWGENDEVLRSYVALPFGTVDPAEDPCAHAADADGIQLQVAPMCAESHYRTEGAFFLPPTIKEFFIKLIFAPLISAQLSENGRRDERLEQRNLAEEHLDPVLDEMSRPEMLEDPYEFAEWDQTQTVRCFVHPCNSSGWRQITGTNSPHPPLSAKDYHEAGIPWFDDYRDDGKPILEDSSITPDRIAQSGNPRRHGEIREFLDTP